MSLPTTHRISLLTMSMAGLVVALATVVMRGDSDQARGSGLVLPSPTPHVDPVDGGVVVEPARFSRRSTSVAQLDAPPTSAELPPPQPRLAAASWMRARNSAFVVTPEQRLAELLQYRKHLAASGNGSFLHRQHMLTLATAAAATHLDQLGQATLSSGEAGPYQWKFSTGGAQYVFERGKFPAYDAAREAWEAVAYAAGDRFNSAGLAFSAVAPVPDETLERIDTFVESAVQLLTSTE